MTDRICSVEGCPERHFAKDYCAAHYRRLKVSGALRKSVPIKRLRPRNQPCSIEGCASLAKTQGWCTKHYAAFKRHGDPTVLTKPRTNAEQAVKDMLAVDLMPLLPYPGTARQKWPCTCLGCGAEVEPTYQLIRAGGRAIHARLRRWRGSASDHECVDCGRPAEDWSYQGGSGQERVSTEGLRYSADVSAYSPRCKSCHAIHDGLGGSHGS